MGSQTQPIANNFFEISYEIANKVGGIYAVIKSKTNQMIRYYKDKYYTIGYYEPEKYLYEFEQREPNNFRPIFDELLLEGIRCYYGAWNAPGNPKCILVDAKGYANQTNQIKTKLWEDYQIDSLRTGPWFNDPVVWSHACGKLLEKLAPQLPGTTVAQFHEWLSGAGLLHLKKTNAPIGTVFTTHATMLGRTIAGNQEDLPAMIEKGLAEGKTVPDEKAAQLGVLAKHQLEKTCAHQADVFTTVSKPTAQESTYILGKKPDIITLNGLDMQRFPSMEELSYLHKKYKDEITGFLSAYFAPYYDIDISKDPRIIFLSGRYEFHNKGADVFIDALAKVDKKLREEKNARQIFAFIFMPSSTTGEKFEVLKNVSLYEELKDHIDECLPDLKERILQAVASGKKMEKILLGFYEENYNKTCKKLALAFKSRKNQKPPLCAYELSYGEENDSIIQRLRQKGLTNSPENKVKVIFYPTYISSAGRLLSLEYYPTIIGCSLGIFPSYYEPWGYTPHEAAANGCVSITTDYSGFGQFILDNVPQDKPRGIYVLKRKNKTYEQVVNQLAEAIHEIGEIDRNQIISLKTDAREIANLADWSILSQHYIQAHNLAAQRCAQRT